MKNFNCLCYILETVLTNNNIPFTKRNYWNYDRCKEEYDVNRKEIYYENSDGLIRDNRPKQVELTLAEIASKLNIPLNQLRIKD